MELKSELERHVASTKGTDETVDAITKKMASRVQKYETTFSGIVSPKSLLVGPTPAG